MGSQTRTWQQRIIDGAKQRQDLASLFWAVEWEREPGKYQIALLGGRLPVVPLAPDVTDATDAAQVLMFALQSGKLGKWALCLVDTELLNELGCAWFVWPEMKGTPEVSKPKRIQRKRVKGWKKPPGCVNVTRPGKWGNPYQVKPVRRGTAMKWIVVTPDSYIDTEFDSEEYAAQVALSAYQFSLSLELDANPGALDELRGKDLMCWCKEGDPCHGDILLRFANG